MRCASVPMIEDMGYDNLVISIKSSDVMMCAKAHELHLRRRPIIRFTSVSQKPERFIPAISNQRSDLESFSYQGIGDTIRVSLTGDPLEEVKSAKADPKDAWASQRRH